MKVLIDKFLIVLFLIGSLGFSQQSESNLSEIAQFQRALELYNKEQYVAAQKLFNQVQLNTNQLQLQSNARFYEAQSMLYLNHPKAALEMEKFIRENPTSNKRNAGILALGNYYFYQSDFKTARRYLASVDTYLLNREEKVDYNFRYGYTLFKTGNEDKAENFLKRVSKNDEYANQANYYLGFIAYQNDDYPTAEKYFAATNLDEVSNNTTYVQADMKFKNGEFQDAIRLATAYVEKANPRERSDLSKIIGESYFNLEQYKEAIPYLSQYEGERGKWNNIDYYQLGFAYFKQNDFEKAISEFNKILGGDDEIAQNAYYHLGKSYLELEKNNQALNAFKNAYEMDFNEKIKRESHLNYAKLSYQVGNPYTSVHEVLISFMEAYPEAPETNQLGELLIDAYISSKNYESAIQILEGSRDYKDKVAYQKVTYLYGVELFKDDLLSDAKTYFEKSLSQRLDASYTAKATYWKAEVDYLKGDYKEAIVGFKEFERMNASKNTNEYKHIDYNLGYSYFKNKNYAEAQAHFEKFSKNTSQKTQKYDAYVRLGDSYFGQGKYWPAMESYNQALAIGSPKSDYAFYQKAYAYGFVDRNNKKIEELTNFVNQFPKSQYLDNAYYELGNTYVAENQDQKGLQAYQKIITNLPNSRLIPRALSKQGLIHYNNNQYAEALSKLKLLVKEHPDSEQATQAVNTVRLIYIDMDQPELYAAWVNDLDFVEVADADLDNTTFEAAENSFLNGNSDRAISGFKKYLDQFPKGIHSLKSNFYLAQLLYNSDKKEESLPYYKNVYEASFNEFSEQSMNRLAQIYLEKDNYQEAIPVLEKLEQKAEFKQNIVFAKTNLMKAYYSTEDFKKTLDYADQVLVMSGVEERALNDARIFKARAAVAREDFSTARKAYQLVFENASGSRAAEALYYEAFFQHEEGNYEASNESIQLLTKDFSRYREFAFKSLVLWAKNFRALDDAFQANYILENVIKNASKFPEIVEEAEKELADLNKEQSKTNASLKAEDAENDEENEDTNKKSSSNRPIKF